MRPIEQQIIFVTGATDGLGRAVARELAGLGATLLLHGRSDERGQRTLTEIKAQTGNHKLTYYRADFESLSEVRHLAERIEADQARLDVLLNNAALGIDPVRRVTVDGYESTFQVDYLAPYMLSYLLENLLIASAPSRIGPLFRPSQEARALPEAYDERARARLRAVAEQLTGVSRDRSASGPD